MVSRFRCVLRKGKWEHVVESRLHDPGAKSDLVTGKEEDLPEWLFAKVLDDTNLSKII